jgi:hypothetical protein
VLVYRTPVTLEDLRGFAAARIRFQNGDAHSVVVGPVARSVPGHAVYGTLVTFEDLQDFAALNAVDTQNAVK